MITWKFEFTVAKLQKTAEVVFESKQWRAYVVYRVFYLPLQLVQVA